MRLCQLGLIQQRHQSRHKAVILYARFQHCRQDITMKLTAPRFFKVGRGNATLHISKEHYKSSYVQVVYSYPNGRMEHSTCRLESLRTVLDALSRGLDVGGRIEAPAEGINFVEAIDKEEFDSVFMGFRTYKNEVWQRRRQTSHERYLAKKQARPAQAHPLVGRRLDLEL